MTCNFPKGGSAKHNRGMGGLGATQRSVVVSTKLSGFSAAQSATRGNIYIRGLI